MRGCIQTLKPVQTGNGYVTIARTLARLPHL
jgi:hypothetical protein